MRPDTLLPALLALGVCIALPAIAAHRRRRLSRESSEVAAALADFARSLRHSPGILPVDESLLTRARRLGIPEMVGFDYARGLSRPEPVLLADAAHRLALRLKRRVAFERKMLARTAPGRWRGALAAAAPAPILIALGAAGESLPTATLALLLSLEGLGCWLLWRLARVAV
jgi:hypothetical protein